MSLNMKLTSKRDRCVLCDILSYRHPIVIRIAPLDSSCREHSFETFNISFAPISRPLSHTFTLGWNFEPLTLSWNYLGYRHAIGKRLPGLDSPSRDHSLETLNVSFAPVSRLPSYTFTPGRNFGPLTISWNYLGYRHAIVKR